MVLEFESGSIHIIASDASEPGKGGTHSCFGLSTGMRELTSKIIRERVTMEHLIPYIANTGCNKV